MYTVPHQHIQKPPAPFNIYLYHLECVHPGVTRMCGVTFPR